MNKRSRIYRRIYREHYGEIPTDDMGRTYDIHHIDGDSTNNAPSNLLALSIKDHYELHKRQGDWGAASRLHARMKRNPEEISELTRQMNLANAEQGIHWSQVASKNGIHPFQNKEVQKHMAEHAKLNGNRSVDREWTCEVCNKTGKGMSNYARYHGENCGKSSVSRGRLWVNNGESSKMIEAERLEDHLTEGWSLGRGTAEITPRRTNSNGTYGRVTQYVRKTARPYKKKTV